MKKSLFLFSAMLLFFGLSCERAKKVQEGTTTTPTGIEQNVEALKQQEPTPLPGGSVSVANLVLHPANKAAVVLSVEVARSPEEKRQGLQGRENLPEKHGMWFIFDDDVQDPFWMKDTPLALDMAFVDKDYKIVDIIKNTTPNSETLLIPRSKYRYTLEIKAGTADEFGIAAGDAVEFRLGPP